MALRACGRLRVTVATFSATSTIKHSYLAYLDIFSSIVLFKATPALPVRPAPLSGASRAVSPPKRHEATSRQGPAPASAERMPDELASPARPPTRFPPPAPPGTRRPSRQAAASP